MRMRECGPPVYQYFQYFVIVFVSRQLERSDVRGVGGSHGVLDLPGVESSSLTNCRFDTSRFLTK